MTVRPICIKCRRFLKPKKTGMYFTEGMPSGDPQTTQWMPYKVWSGDVWGCIGCGAEIIVGTGQKPIVEKHEHGFDDMRRRLGADKLMVEDC